MLKSCLPPVDASDTRLLVLGSLPGEASLAAARYYAHPQNAFWRLMGEVIGTDLAALAYEARLAALLTAGVGLWDTIATARRPGSLDAAIRDAETNDLAALAARLPNLRAVGLNGALAAKRGAAALAGTGVALVPLPSSSPAHTMAWLAKRDAWMALAPYLRG